MVPSEERDDDPLAWLVAGLILVTIVVFALIFITVVGGLVAPATMWHWIVVIGPWYVGLGGTLVLARWIVRRRLR
jgi:hypothetical protein